MTRHWREELAKIDPAGVKPPAGVNEPDDVALYMASDEVKKLFGIRRNFFCQLETLARFCETHPGDEDLKAAIEDVKGEIGEIDEDMCRKILSNLPRAFLLFIRADKSSIKIREDWSIALSDVVYRVAGVASMLTDTPCGKTMTQVTVIRLPRGRSRVMEGSYN